MELLASTFKLTVIAPCCSLVDPQTPSLIEPLVRNFLDAEFAKLNSKNTMDVSYEGGGLPWVGDKDHWNFQAADAATRVRAVRAGLVHAIQANHLHVNRTSRLFTGRALRRTMCAKEGLSR